MLSQGVLVSRTRTSIESREGPIFFLMWSCLRHGKVDFLAKNNHRRYQDSDRNIKIAVRSLIFRTRRQPIRCWMLNVDKVEHGEVVQAGKIRYCADFA